MYQIENLCIYAIIGCYMRAYGNRLDISFQNSQ